jgi:hypothetical protein
LTLAKVPSPRVFPISYFLICVHTAAGALILFLAERKNCSSSPLLLSHFHLDQNCARLELMHAQADNNATLCGHNRTHLIHHQKPSLYALALTCVYKRLQNSPSNTSYIMACMGCPGNRPFPPPLQWSVVAVHRSTWFQILCCRIAWQNLASKLRDICIYKLLVFSLRHAWGKKEKSKVTDLLLHRSKRSFCQDHNTDATSSKANPHAR